MSRATLNVIRWDLRRRPAVDDLVLVLAISVLAAVAALLNAPIYARVPLGLVSVLLLPGYVLTLALFPRSRDLGRVERAALAAGVSLSIVTALVVVLDRTPWGLRATPLVVVVTVWTLAITAIAWLRRRNVALAERGALLGRRPAWRDLGGRRGLALVAVAGALVLVGIGVQLQTQASSRMTEFYALGSDGLAAGYPRAARAGEVVTVGIGIVNREGAPVTYQVAVQGESGPLASPRSIEIPDGAAWEGSLEFVMPNAMPDQEVKLVLLKHGQREPHRQLRLWIDGVPPGAPSQ